MAFYITNCQKISMDFLRKSTVTFPEISGKIPQEISGNFPTYNPSGEYRAEWRRRTRVADPSPEGFNPA